MDGGLRSKADDSSVSVLHSGRALAGRTKHWKANLESVRGFPRPAWEGREGKRVTLLPLLAQPCLALLGALERHAWRGTGWSPPNGKVSPSKGLSSPRAPTTLASREETRAGEPTLPLAARAGQAVGDPAS